MTPQIPSEPPSQIPMKSPSDGANSVAAEDTNVLSQVRSSEKKRRYKKRQPRSRNLHVGVVVLKSDKYHPYPRLRFPNPDYDPDLPGSPKHINLALEPHQRNHTELAIAKRDELGLDRFGHLPKREKSGPVSAPLSITNAIALFFASDKKYSDPKDGTGRSYRKAITVHFEPWAVKRGLKTVDDITLKNLGPGERRLPNGQLEVCDSLKVTVQKATVMKPKKGGQPGETEDTGIPLSSRTIGKELRSISACLGWLIDHGHITKLTRGELTIALENKSLEDEEPEGTAIDDVHKILDCARAHDAVHTGTSRQQPHIRKRKVRSDFVPPKRKPRWNAIEFLIYFIVCTGMRISEALSITWEQFEPNTSLPGNIPGQTPGAIRLLASQTKNRKMRTVYLCVCPSIVTLLLRLRGDALPTDRIFAALTYPRATGARERLLAKSGQEQPRSKRKDRKPIKQLVKGTRQVKEKAPLPPSGFDAPVFDYQHLRATCATWLATLRGPNFESQQLGHGVQVAEAWYVGRVVIPAGASTLEEAMGLREPYVIPTVRDEIKHIRQGKRKGATTDGHRNTPT